MDAQEKPFNYQEFPFAVILSIISTSMLLLPMYAMYQRKLHFECVSTCLCLFTTLTYVLHDTTDKIPFRDPNIDHTIYNGNLYFGLGTYDWMKLSGIIQTFVTVQCWTLVCQNNEREFDELTWGAFFVLISIMYESKVWIFNVVIPVAISMALPVIKHCCGRPKHKISINQWDVIGIGLLWFFCYLFYSLAYAWEYNWEYLLRLHFYSGTAFFSVALNSIVIGVKVKDRDWYVKAYGQEEKEKEFQRRDESMERELGNISQGHVAVVGKGEVEYTDYLTS